MDGSALEPSIFCVLEYYTIFSTSSPADLSVYKE